VAGDEINTIDGQAAGGLVEVGTASNARGSASHQPRIAFDKAAHIVAVAPVPFAPTLAWEAADLIESGSVPGFGDGFGIGQRFI